MKKTVIIAGIILIALLSMAIHGNRNHRYYEAPIQIEEWMTVPFDNEPLEVEEWMTKPFMEEIDV